MLTGNLHPEQARATARRGRLSRLVAHFYSYAQAPDGLPRCAAGQPRQPRRRGPRRGRLPGLRRAAVRPPAAAGETLVAFLSDGAAEEQRGSDWMPRWWRAEDCGVALPVMIANGRRIEQRTELGTPEGLGRLRRAPAPLRLRPDPLRRPRSGRLRLHPARDGAPAGASARGDGRGILEYPLPMPYAIAETVKGFGLPRRRRATPRTTCRCRATRTRDAEAPLFNASAAALGPRRRRWSAPAGRVRRAARRPSRRARPPRWRSASRRRRSSPSCISTTRPVRQ